MPKDKLKSIKGVEIFAAGVWNGDEYSVKDLDEMVQAFDETAKTFRPPLKLGHSPDQVLLQRDGLPAAGWIGSLYRKGKKLLADFIDIPDKVFQLLERGAYKKVSAEIFWNAKVGEKEYRRLLSAIALLGADLPGVTNLSDIFQMYAADAGDLKCYDLRQESFIITVNTDVDRKAKEERAMEKSEKEIQLEQELAAEKQKSYALSEQLKNVQKDTGDKDKQIEELKTKQTEAEEKALETEKKLFVAQIERELTELSSEKLITPAMKPYVKALLEEDKKEYSFKPEGKDEEKFSKAGLLKQILKLHTASASVNFDESSEANEVKGQTDEKALQEKIQRYAKEHGVEVGVAYRAVLKAEKASQPAA